MAHFSQLHTEMEKLSADGNELEAAGDKLFAAARKAGDQATVTLAGQVEAAVLLVAIANWRFLATRDANGPKTFRSNLEKARAILADLESSSPPDQIRVSIKPMQVLLDRNATSFEAVAVDVLKINEQYDKMMPQLATMRVQVDTAEDRLRKQFVDSRNSAVVTIAATMRVQEVVGAVALALGGLFAFWIAGSIIRPLASMTDSLGKLAAGRTEIQIPGRDAGDEIGSMARAAEIFKQNAIERVRLEARISDDRAAVTRKDEMRQLADEFEREVGVIVGTVSSASSELESSAAHLSLSAEATQQLSATVATASEQASTNVRAVAAAAEQLADSWMRLPARSKSPAGSPEWRFSRRKRPMRAWLSSLM